MEFGMGVHWLPNFSVLGWTGFWGGSRRKQAVYHFEMSRFLTLISQMSESSLWRHWISLWGPSRHWMKIQSHLDYGFPGSKLRSRFSMTSCMLLSSLYLFVVRMLRSQRDSLSLAVIFMSPHVVSQRSIDVCVRPGESWMHWVMGCGVVGIYAGWKSEYKYLLLPVLLYRCETWTLTNDLRWRLNSFGTRSLQRNLGHRWSDFVSIERLLRETQMRLSPLLVCLPPVLCLWAR